MKCAVVAGLVAAVAATPAPAQVTGLTDLPGQTLACQLSLVATFNPPVGASGGSGTFAAGGGGVVNVSRCNWNGDQLAVRTAKAVMQGTYTATSCDTFVLRGGNLGTRIDLDNDPWGPIVADMTYTLDVRSWQGVLKASHVQGRTEYVGDDVDGAFTVVPEHPCLDHPLVSVTLDGAFAVGWG